MEMTQGAARSWMPDSGYWIMADFHDGHWTMESFQAHPGLGLQEDITKKGRVLPMENGQWKGGSAGNQTPASHFITDYC